MLLITYFRMPFLLCLTLCHHTNSICFKRRDPKYVYRNLTLNSSIPCLNKFAGKVGKRYINGHSRCHVALGNPWKPEVDTENCRINRTAGAFTIRIVQCMCMSE